MINHISEDITLTSILNWNITMRFGDHTISQTISQDCCQIEKCETFTQSKQNECKEKEIGCTHNTKDMIENHIHWSKP